MDHKIVKGYFKSPEVIEHYSKLAVSKGLWKSESKVFLKEFKRNNSLLEIGSGAGRIAITLWCMGYRNISAIDYSQEMIDAAINNAEALGCGINFIYGDALELAFPEGAFDGVVFGFNGLMQIPKSENRLKAMRETHKVLKPGGKFIFTTVLRSLPEYSAYWEEEQLNWERGMQNENLDDFGDVYQESDMGMLYVHYPSIEEVEADLKKAGFRIKSNQTRSLLANESQEVKAYSKECIFWVTVREE